MKDSVPLQDPNEGGSPATPPVPPPPNLKEASTMQLQAELLERQITQTKNQLASEIATLNQLKGRMGVSQ